MRFSSNLCSSPNDYHSGTLRSKPLAGYLCQGTRNRWSWHWNFLVTWKVREKTCLLEWVIISAGATRGETVCCSRISLGLHLLAIAARPGHYLMGIVYLALGLEALRQVLLLLCLSFFIGKMQMEQTHSLIICCLIIYLKYNIPQLFEYPHISGSFSITSWRYSISNFVIKTIRISGISIKSWSCSKSEVGKLWPTASLHMPMS